MTRHDLDLEHFKKKLKEEEKLLLEELKTVGRVNPGNPNDWEAKPDSTMDTPVADSNDLADSYEAYTENAGILTELEIRLGNIKSAQKRIEEGSYGICTICNQPIEKERLEANPAALTCKEHMK